MIKIILFDPSYGTSNQGDLIINEAIMKEMEDIFTGNYVIRYSTHSPLMHLHQLLKKNFISRNCEEAGLKFLGGSNIFKNNLFKYTLDWNINIFTKRLYLGSISIGGGLEGKSQTVNWYTRHIYKTVLSKNVVHSVRDNESKVFLESMGFSASNTGCPTLWGLSTDKCSNIPEVKSRDVVFTLTDYKKDYEDDKRLIEILHQEYRKIYFWVQGTEDLEYLESLKVKYKIEIVPPNLDSYKKVLFSGNIDYIGTRLHAGIYAMQHNVRSIILAIDNRTRDMKKDYGLNVIERHDISKLPSLINSSFSTKVRINEGEIKKWKDQFGEFTNLHE